MGSATAPKPGSKGGELEPDCAPHLNALADQSPDGGLIDQKELDRTHRLLFALRNERDVDVAFTHGCVVGCGTEAAKKAGAGVERVRATWLKMEGRIGHGGL
jgi:hypothetical protein